MKIETKTSVLLSKNLQMIVRYSSKTKNILIYFSCYDNFFKVKFVVLYFVRLSLATTIMQKHEFSNTYEIF